MDQEKVWDAVAEDWANFRTRPVDEVKEFLEGKSGKVLDLGCGSGRNFIESGDLKFYGVDFSGKLLKIADSRGYVELKKGMTDAIPYGDGFFDWVVFVRVLHCVETEAKRKKTLEEVYRVLERGGEAVICYDTNAIWEISVQLKPRMVVVPGSASNSAFRHRASARKDHLAAA